MPRRQQAVGNAIPAPRDEMHLLLPLLDEIRLPVKEHAGAGARTPRLFQRRARPHFAHLSVMQGLLALNADPAVLHDRLVDHPQNRLVLVTKRDQCSERRAA